MAKSPSHAVSRPKERVSESAEVLLVTTALCGPLSMQVASGWEILVVVHDLAGMRSLIYDQNRDISR